MKLRHCWLVLALMGFGGSAPARAQDREVTAAERKALDAAKEKGATSRWHVDFWPAWPKPPDSFLDVYLAGATDALELGYYLDEQSISPKHFYGVIVPRFGVVRDGRNFLVELNSRRVVGVLDGPGFAFPKTADAAWSYHWAPDGASLIVEQADERNKVRGRRVLQLVELRDGSIAKETDLLKQPGKTPPWFDARGLPPKEHSSPLAPGAALRLAESSPGPDAWWVQREAMGGPLQMMKGGERVATLPAVGGLVAEAKGELRTISSDAASGLPLCFFSPDEKWLFVNQITRVDELTGGHWRSAALYRRTDAADGKAAQWELAMPEALDERAWQAFAQAAGVPAESIAPPDASGFRDRTIEFVAWSEKTGYHALVYLRARNGAVPAAHPSYYRWYCYFNTKTLEFERDTQLQSANEELRTRWNSGDESLSTRNVQLRATYEGQAGVFAPISDVAHFADDALNSAYQALLRRAPKEQVEEQREKQRAWLGSRETIAWVHTLQRWTRFTDAVLEEGRLLATDLRAEDLREEAIASSAGPNTVLRDKSPDGKFAILYTYAATDIEQGGRPEGITLLALPAKKVVLDLYDDTENQSLAASWAPDSQHLAFHQASRRIAETLIYERRGDQFVALKMPNMDPYEPRTRKGDRQGHFNYADLAVKRWLGAKKLLVHHGIEFDVQGNEGNGETRTVSADYDLVLTIEKGKVVVEKATKAAPQN